MKLVYILDDHKLFSSGLELLLRSASKKIKSRSFDNSKAMFGFLEKSDHLPDLALLDLYIPGEDISLVIESFRDLSPTTRIIVVSASISLVDRKGAFVAGAEMVLSKSSEPEVLLDAINNLLSGKTSREQPKYDSPASKFNLTPKQLEILLLATKGMSNKEIARILEISPETIKSHLRDVFHRLDVSNRVEAIDFARSIGLA